MLGDRTGLSKSHPWPPFCTGQQIGAIVFGGRNDKISIIEPFRNKTLSNSDHNYTLPAYSRYVTSALGNSLRNASGTR
jgi:hypothetical protein